MYITNHRLNIFSFYLNVSPNSKSILFDFCNIHSFNNLTKVTCTVLSTGRRRTIPIIVKITDLNDNAPRFQGKKPYVMICCLPCPVGSDSGLWFLLGHMQNYQNLPKFFKLKITSIVCKIYLAKLTSTLIQNYSLYLLKNCFTSRWPIPDNHIHRHPLHPHPSRGHTGGNDSIQRLGGRGHGQWE